MSEMDIRPINTLVKTEEYERLQSDSEELRKCLAELVELEQVKEDISAIEILGFARTSTHMDRLGELYDAYTTRKPLAWQSAKELLERLNNQNG